MKIEEFDNLLNDFENDDLDFRTSLGDSADKDRDLKTLSAFYNTRGGKIIFGVQEDGTTRKVVGLLQPAQVIESNFVSKIKGKMKPEPDPFPSFEFIHIAGHDVVIVYCERGSNPPYEVNGECYVRKGSNNVKVTKEGLSELYRRNTTAYDHTVLPHATLDDLDVDLARTTLEKRERTQVINGDLHKLLCRIGILVNVKSEFKPTVAGMLLFGINPQDFLPHTRIRAEAKSDPDSSEWDDIAEFSGNIFQQLKDFESFVRRNVKVSAKIIGFERIETPDIPFEALREGIINAITHRDYSDRGAEIQLRIHGKKVVIESPGGLIAPLTVSSILAGDFIPKTRNPVVADMLVQLGYMDKRGTGLRRMIQLSEEAGLERPSFEELADGFRVIFDGSGNMPLEKRGSIVIPEKVLKNLDDEHKKILKFLEKKGKISSTESQILIRRSKPHALKKLNDLVGWKILEPTSAAKNNPNIRYTLHKNLTDSSHELSTAEKGGQQKLLDL